MWWRNDYAPHLFAQLSPISGGTHIEGYFGFGSWISKCLTITLVIGGALAAFMVISTAYEVLFGHRFDSGGDPLPAMIVPPLAVVVFWLIPKLNYNFSSWHEDDLLQFLQTTLAASEQVAGAGQ